MKPYSPFLTLLTLLISLCIGSSLVVAQEAIVEDKVDAKVSAETLVLESNTLLDEINDLYNKTMDLRGYAKTLDDSDRFLYFNLISTIEEKLRLKLDRVMEIKTRLSNRNSDVNVNLQATKTIVKQQSSRNKDGCSYR